MIAILTSDFDRLEQYLSADYVSNDTPSGRVYFRKMGNTQILVADVGSTKVNVSRNVESIIQRYCPNILIAVGNIAGLNDQEIGSVILSNESIQYDVDVSALGFGLGEIPEIRQTYFRANEGLIGYAQNSANALGLNTSLARVGSADRFVASTESANSIRSQFGIDALDMETATIGELAYIDQLDYISIKGVSNRADNNAVSEQRANKDTADQNAMRIALDVAQMIAFDDRDNYSRHSRRMNW